MGHLDHHALAFPKERPLFHGRFRGGRASLFWASGVTFPTLCCAILFGSGALLGCDEDESARDLAQAFGNAEDEVCERAGEELQERHGDPALNFYFGAYCWPEQTPWAECVAFKKGFSWGPPPAFCWEEVRPHIKCLSELKSEGLCQDKFPVSATCSPLVPEKPKWAPQDCYCDEPAFFADYKGTPIVQEFREVQSGCGPEHATFELRCSVLDDGCGTDCGCFEEGRFVRDVHVEPVHDMSFRAEAWRACGFPEGECR
jgi:hypothetical protein